MAKILIAYASMSGNTEEISELIKSNLEPFGHDIGREEIEQLDIQKLVEYDGILLGVYTWGNGDLPYEVEDFYDEIESVDLTGKKLRSSVLVIVLILSFVQLLIYWRKN